MTTTAMADAMRSATPRRRLAALLDALAIDDQPNLGVPLGIQGIGRYAIAFTPLAGDQDVRRDRVQLALSVEACAKLAAEQLIYHGMRAIGIWDLFDRERFNLDGPELRAAAHYVPGITTASVQFEAGTH